MPYRIAAPPEPDPPEVEHPYAVALRRQRRHARILTVLVVLGAGVGVAKMARSGEVHRDRRTTEAERVQRARSAIAAARARASRAQVAFEVGVRDAIGRDVAPRPELGRCPIELPDATAPVSRKSAFPLLTIARAELAETLPSQAVAEVLADVRRAEAHLAAGRHEEAALYARALDRPERFGFDVVLVARTAKKPIARSGSEFDAGEIEGRAYVYDHASGRVICAGDVHARSSPSIGYTFSDRVDAPARLGVAASMGDAIDEDMRVQTQRAIATAVLWRSDPPSR